MLGRMASDEQDPVGTLRGVRTSIKWTRYAPDVLPLFENMGVEGMVSAEQIAGGFAERAASMTTAERAAGDRTWAFGHVVVDEAQELSPMQWRLLSRRCPLRSFTVVGDIAQASSPASAGVG